MHPNSWIFYSQTVPCLSAQTTHCGRAQHAQEKRVQKLQDLSFVPPSKQGKEAFPVKCKTKAGQKQPFLPIFFQPQCHPLYSLAGLSFGYGLTRSVSTRTKGAMDPHPFPGDANRASLHLELHPVWWWGYFGDTPCPQIPSQRVFPSRTPSGAGGGRAHVCPQPGKGRPGTLGADVTYFSSEASPSVKAS